MPDSMQQIIAGVRTLLRRVSDLKLTDGDIREMAHDLLRGYVQDMDLGGREHRTHVVEVEFDEDDLAGEYILMGPNADFEPTKLEYSGSGSTVGGWHEAHIVPLASWGRQSDQNYAAAAFYDGQKRVRLNLSPEQVSGLVWKLTYREPLLAIVQTGQRPPLPTNHLPMFKRELAIACIPLVQDNTDEWKEWAAGAILLWEAELGSRENPKGHTLRGRWRAYLDSSVEPQIMDVRPYDDFRRRASRRERAYLPRE